MKTFARLVSVALVFLLPSVAYAADPTLGTALEDVMANAGPGETATSVRLIVLLTALTLLPGLILAMTPFTRFIIVFGLLRQALGLQQSPPNQVLIGLSLALSLLVM
jgi:flagellar biosynthetic protein FliP